MFLLFKIMSNNKHIINTYCQNQKWNNLIFNSKCTSKLIIVNPTSKYETTPILPIIEAATMNIPPSPSVNPLYILLGNYPIANPI